MNPILKTQLPCARRHKHIILSHSKPLPRLIGIDGCRFDHVRSIDWNIQVDGFVIEEYSIVNNGNVISAAVYLHSVCLHSILGGGANTPLL